MKGTKFLLLVSLSVVMSCSNQSLKEGENQATDAHAQSEDNADIVGTPAPGSKFSKIKIGMSPQHVMDIIGRPTDQKSYRTAKSWFPYYYGNDSVRREFIYKNEGRLTFGGNGKLIKITVDRTEDGYEGS